MNGYKILYVTLNLLALWSLKNVAVVATSPPLLSEERAQVQTSATKAIAAQATPNLTPIILQVPQPSAIRPQREEAAASSSEKTTVPSVAKSAAAQASDRIASETRPIPTKLTPKSGHPAPANPAPTNVSTQASDLLPPNSVLAQNQTAPENIDPPATLQDLQPLVVPVLELPRSGFAPGLTFGTPSGFGADRQTAFIGLSYGSQGRDIKDDGSIVVGAGFGDAVQSVGFETTVAIISLADSFADSGTVGFKVHKTFPNSRTGIAVGWSDAIKWGDASREKNTIYGVVTQGFAIPLTETTSLPIAVSLGVGTGQFRSNGAQKAGENVPNLFANVGVRVSPEISLITSWTGAQLNLGVGVTPFQSLPLAFTLGVADITGASTTGTRFLFNAGFAISF